MIMVKLDLVMKQFHYEDPDKVLTQTSLYSRERGAPMIATKYLHVSFD